MSGSQVLSLVIGIVCFVYGVCVIVWRVQFTRFAKKMETTLYGRLGKAVSDRFSPALIAVIGAVFVLFGAVVLICLASGHPLLPGAPR